MSEKFHKFPKKYPLESVLWEKVAGDVTFPENVFLEIFRIVFAKKPQMAASAIVTGKCFNQNTFFWKELLRRNIFSSDFSHSYFDIQWHVFLRVKCKTENQEFWTSCVLKLVKVTAKVVLVTVAAKNYV